MSQVKKIKILFVLIGAFIVAAVGCSSANKDAQFDPNTGKHPADWYVGHRSAYLANPSNCTPCHGTDLRGGVANMSCFSASFNGMTCHPGGPSGHPAGWASPDSHGAAAKAVPNTTTTNGFDVCRACHGADFAGSTGVTCLNTAGCHGATVSAPHSPKPWRGGTRTHITTNIGNAPVCVLCHTNGANSPVQPSPPAAAGTAPGCFNNTLCHGAQTAACGTCHGIPPNSGRHTVHTALPNVGVVDCNVCHNGAGSGTALHQDGIVEVAFLSTYNAKSGTASFDGTASTCSKVSCHGGQTTPNWLTGAIDVNTQCSACHISGTTQYNGYFSGHHSTHVSKGIACTECHDTTKLSTVHFNDLNTTAMTQAYLTLLNALNYTGSGGGTFGNCTINCHNENHNARAW